MRRPILATLTLGILVVAAVVAACSAPARVAPITTTTEQAAVPRVPPPQVKAVTDQELLQEMQSANGVAINDYLNRGQEVPEYFFERAQQLEQTRLALYQLEGQRQGLSTLVMQYCAAGNPAPDCVFDLLNAVEQSRQDALEEIGLHQ